MSDLIALGQQFERFAERECQASPLYRELASRIAQDEALLEIAAHGEAGPKPNLFLAAVHYLLLSGVEHWLGMYYPTISGSEADPTVAFGNFREFALEHADSIRNLMESRLVQTNEVRRSAILLPAMQLIQEREQNRPLDLIEVGASAGLLLLLDRYSYNYGPYGRYGQPDSPLKLTCEVRGEQVPPLADTPLNIAGRRGIDLNPVDVTKPDEALWLQALVWPDQPERLHRLRQAIFIVARQPPQLYGGDALEVLPDLLANTGPEGVCCVFHCHTLNQFSPENREKFGTLLASHSDDRVVYEIALESYANAALPELTLNTFRHGSLDASEVLAHYDPHGAWLEWL